MRRTGTFGLCVGLLASLAAADTAKAQPGGGRTEVSEAQRLFEQGVAMLGESRFAEALDLFLESYRLESQPVVLLNIGMCRKVLGDLPAAHDTLGRYLAEVGRNATGELADSARQAVAEIELATGTVALQVDPPGASVSVDGDAVAPGELAEPLRLMPGSHVVEVRGEGLIPDRRTVEVGAGAAVQLAIRLEPPAPEPEPAAAAAPPDERTSGLEIGAWVGVGVAAAAAATAAITGSLALIARDDFVNGGATDADLRRQAADLGLATDVMIGAAAAGAVVALVLFLVDAGDEGPDAAGDDVVETTTSVVAIPGGLAVWW